MPKCLLAVSSACALLLCLAQSALAVSQAQPLTLRDAVSLALKNHPTVREGELNLRAAQLELQIAKARTSLPELGLRLQSASSLAQGVGSWTLQSALAADLTLPWGATVRGSSVGGWDVITNTWTVSYGLDLTQRISLTSGEGEELEAKEEALRRAEQARRRAEQAVVIDAVERFGKLLSSQAALATAERSLEQALALAASVQAALAAGQAGERQRLESELAVKEAQIALRERITDFAMAQEEFGSLLGTEGAYELVPTEFRLGALLDGAKELLAQEIPAEAVEAAEGVQKARDALETARKQLQSLHAAALPAATLAVGLAAKGWQVGITIEFALFSPLSQAEEKLARVVLALAQERLKAAQQQARLAVLNQKAALRRALAATELLPLEAERWALEETIMRQRFDAGLVSSAAVADFQHRKAEWENGRTEKAFALMLAHLRYRSVWASPLRWEEVIP